MQYLRQEPLCHMSLVSFEPWLWPLKMFYKTKYTSDVCKGTWKNGRVLVQHYGCLKLETGHNLRAKCYFCRHKGSASGTFKEVTFFIFFLELFYTKLQRSKILHSYEQYYFGFLFIFLLLYLYVLFFFCWSVCATWLFKDQILPAYCW